MLVALLALTAGCGSGTAALVSGGGGGTGNAAPALSAFQVAQPRGPRARIEFTLTDNEGDPARVELFYQVPGEAPARLSALTGPGANPDAYSASKTGSVHALEWDFPAEAALPASGALQPGVRVFGLVEGGVQQVLLGTNAAELALGNDAPVLTLLELPAGPEVVGIAAVRLRVADSTGDAVDVRVEYAAREPGGAWSGWERARPAGIPALTATPEYAIETLIAAPGGTEVTFFWDVVADLGRDEREVRLRFTPLDRDAHGAPFLAGGAVQSAAFRVDNNVAPIAFLQGEQLQLGEDESGGIPLPFEVLDPEGDLVRLVFQWRRAGEDFPELPQDVAELDALLDDPVAREELQICTELPRPFGGRVDFASDAQLRLAAFAGWQQELVDGRLVGATLELLRARRLPASAAEGWSGGGVHAPVAASPLGDGVRALVLERPAAGAWGLTRVDLATGARAPVVAPAAGEPRALALTTDGASALVGLGDGGAWSLVRVELADGAAQELASGRGPLRALAPLGPRATLVAAGDAVLRVDHMDPADVRVGVLAAGFEQPVALVIDRALPDRALVGARDAGGVGALYELSTVDGAARRLAVEPMDGAAEALPRLEALALDALGERLLALCDPVEADGSKQLLELPLGSRADRRARPVGVVLPDTAATVASGPFGLLLFAAPGADDLYVGGGVEQARQVTAFEPATGVAAVDAPFDPPLRPGQAWRTQIGSGRMAATPGGTTGSFVWDSSQAGSSGEVLFRVTPYDSERGEASGTFTPRSVAPYDPGRARVVGATVGGEWQPLADVDGDGQLDVVTIDGDRVALALRGRDGELPESPLLLPALGEVPQRVVIGDVDADGMADVVTVNRLRDDLTVFRQGPPGTFAQDPWIVGGPGLLDHPFDVALGDLDGNGLPDLAVADKRHDQARIFYQATVGDFASLPVRLVGSPEDTRRPTSVELADLDSDGDLDLALGCVGQRRAAVYFQEPTGQFGDVPPLLLDYIAFGGILTNVTVDIGAADVDGDGATDLFGTLGYPVVGVYYQEAPGTFSAEAAYYAQDTNGFSTAWLDFDGDGDLDLLRRGPDAEPRPAVQPQLGPRRFAEGSTPLENPLTTSTAHVAAGRFDEDGAVDVVALEGTGELVLLDGSRSPRMETGPFRLEGPSANPQFYQVLFAADCDGNGLVDFATVDTGPTVYRLSLQVAPRSFSQRELAFEPQPLYLGSYGGFADLDGDSAPDMVGLEFDTENRVLVLRVWVQTEPGVFVQDEQQVVWTAEQPGIVDVPDPVVGDFDLDGDRDIALVTITTNPDVDPPGFATILHRVGSAYLPVQELVLLEEAGGGNWELRLMDADGDGRSDLLLFGNDSGHEDPLRLFRGRADGTFEPEPVVIRRPEVGQFLSGVQSADVDGDGRDELMLWFIGSSPAYYVVREESPGRFVSELVELPVTPDVLWIAEDAFADVDGDGDQDWLLRTSGGLLMLEQVLPGTWELRAPLAPPELYELRPEQLFDVDGDGALDVQQTLYVGNERLLLYGTGR